jgi:hypothetical protein
MFWVFHVWVVCQAAENLPSFWIILI